MQYCPDSYNTEKGKKHAYEKFLNRAEWALSTILVFANKFASQQRVDLDQMQGKVGVCYLTSLLWQFINQTKANEMVILKT